MKNETHEHNPSIVYNLYLNSENGIGNKGAIELSRMLMANATLNKLDLRCMEGNMTLNNVQ